MLTFDEQVRPGASECLMMPWFQALQGEGAELSAHQVDALLQHRERASRLWWGAMTAKAATQLPAAELAPLSRLFNDLDEGHVGFVAPEAIRAALQRRGVLREDAEAAVAALDLGRTGRIEWSEFVAALLPASPSLFATGVETAFRHFDLNHDGMLDLDDLTRVLQMEEMSSFDASPTGRLALQAADAMLKELVASGTGNGSSVTFKDFTSYFSTCISGGLNAKVVFRSHSQCSTATSGLTGSLPTNVLNAQKSPHRDLDDEILCVA